jgi:hypothetical protein
MNLLIIFGLEPNNPDVLWHIRLVFWVISTAHYYTYCSKVDAFGNSAIHALVRHRHIQAAFYQYLLSLFLSTALGDCMLAMHRLSLSLLQHCRNAFKAVHLLAALIEKLAPQIHNPSIWLRRSARLSMVVFRHIVWPTSSGLVSFVPFRLSTTATVPTNR